MKFEICGDCDFLCTFLAHYDQCSKASSISKKNNRIDDIFNKKAARKRKLDESRQLNSSIDVDELDTTESSGAAGDSSHTPAEHNDDSDLDR